MMNKKYIDLINREIDGVNSPGESAELKDHMACDPETRRYFEEMSSVAGLLSRARALDPPDGMKQIILSAVCESRIGMRNRSRFNRFLEGFRLGMRPKYAYVFAVGLVAGICLYALFERVSSNGGYLNFDELYGTIAFEKSGSRASDCIPVAIDLPGVRGSAQLQYFDNAILAKVDISSDRNIDIVFRYPIEISFVLFKSLVGADHDIHTEGNRLTLTHTGVSDYLLVFEGETRSRPPLELGIYSDGQLLYEKTMDQSGSRR